MPGFVPSTPPGAETGSSFGDRFRYFWGRHRTLFWNLHSIWALFGGGAVIFLADERYGFVPWVILFLILTWVSTLLFCRAILPEKGSSNQAEPPALHEEVASYLTRVMYQGTLFFLLPFYWYSTVIGSLNLSFSILLAGLAIVSCIDLIFDRWLRTYPWFGLVYFSTVTFAAINLLLPLLFPIGPAVATPLAGLVAVASAIPLAIRGSQTGRSNKLWFALLVGWFLLLVVAFPRLVPPVPLRLERATFTSDIDRETLVAADRLTLNVKSAELRGAIYVLAEVFAPSALPASVSLEWNRDGEEIRTSREIEITAHALGFRIWDGYHSASGKIPPGEYEVTFRTDGQRCFGVAQILVSAD